MLSRRAVNALIGSLAAGAVGGAAAAGGGERPPAPLDVRGWLMRIHEAAGRRSFQGIFVVSAAGMLASSRIAHFGEGPGQFERIDSLDGRQRRVLRYGDVIYTLWPESRTAVVEQRDLFTTFPALLQAGHDHLAAHYELRMQGTERVAGHDANVMLVLPRDRLRYGYRLWADRATDLLLRAEVLGEGSEVLEAAAFSEVSIGVRPHPDSVIEPMRRLDGWRIVRPPLTPTRLDAEGWTLTPPVAGFELVSCVRRPLGSTVPTPADETDEALQAIYADGLTYVSIFVERYDATRHAAPTQVAVGATRTLMRRHGTWWVTVVGDVPAETLRRFAEALHRKP